MPINAERFERAIRVLDVLGVSVIISRLSPKSSILFAARSPRKSLDRVSTLLDGNCRYIRGRLRASGALTAFAEGRLKNFTSRELVRLCAIFNGGPTKNRN